MSLVREKGWLTVFLEAFLSHFISLFCVFCRDLAVIVASMAYNTWFTKLYCKDMRLVNIFHIWFVKFFSSTQVIGNILLGIFDAFGVFFSFFFFRHSLVISVLTTALFWDTRANLSDPTRIFLCWRFGLEHWSWQKYLIMNFTYTAYKLCVQYFIQIFYICKFFVS